MSQDSLFAFVLMPFSQAFDDVYRFGIKETAQSLGIVAERVDEQIYREGILDRIYRQIEVADVIVADMTGKNSNVFYEVGYAHAKGKLCILLTSDADDIPFDLKHRRHIVYSDSIATLRARLKEELDWAQTEVRNVRKSRIAVKVQIESDLRKTDYIAEANVIFKVDLTNETNLPSPEIEALYFYTTSRWRLEQNGKTCASAASDLRPFDKRHFVSCPVRRLTAVGWAQVEFIAHGRIASTFEGDELKSSYRLNGHSVLRIVTSDGNFDHEVRVDTEVTEIPF